MARLKNAQRRYRKQPEDLISDRTVTIIFRVAPEEKQAVEAAADRARITVSEYMRRRVIGKASAPAKSRPEVWHECALRIWAATEVLSGVIDALPADASVDVIEQHCEKIHDLLKAALREVAP